MELKLIKDGRQKGYYEPSCTQGSGKKGTPNVLGAVCLREALKRLTSSAVFAAEAEEICVVGRFVHLVLAVLALLVTYFVIAAVQMST